MKETPTMLAPKTLLLASAVAAAICLSTPADSLAAVVYQDSFSRGSVGTPINLNGTAPDVVNTNGNTWVVSDFNSNASALKTDGSAAVESSTAFATWAYLPVNGVSGVTLNGSQDFTLTASIVAGASLGNGDVGITLNNGAPSYTNNANTLASLEFKSGYVQLLNTSYIGYATNPYSLTTANTFTLTYSATLGRITALINNNPIVMSFGQSFVTVTPAQVQALQYVSFQVYNTTRTEPSVDNFTLTVVPEPSTWALLAGAGAVLVTLRRRRKG
ncbi:MAG: PEP-CTERM sorting domain-containing protein [Terrimicrobiaceae bacterium]